MLVAVDTGGTKTLIADFNSDGILGHQIKFPTPKNEHEYVKELKSNLKSQYGDKHVDAIVVAIPGVIKNGVVVSCGNLPWQNFDIATELHGTLGKTPVFIENDAKLAGLSETRFLKQIPPQSLYVTISTGIGTGIITDGHINEALRNSEAGHALIEYDGVAREWESFASGKAIYETYGQYAYEINSKRTWNKIADRISRGFLAVIPILQPDVVIIGGSIGTYFDKFGDKLVAILTEKLPSITPCPQFFKARYPELAVIYGCYYYALDNVADNQS